MCHIHTIFYYQYNHCDTLSYSKYKIKKLEYSGVSNICCDNLNIFIIILEKLLRGYCQGDRKGYYRLLSRIYKRLQLAIADYLDDYYIFILPL